MAHDILPKGKQLGPYAIDAHIGAGGMGDVYRARDTRLNRFVALKTSQEQYSERFEREMQAIAALSHPNICTLHDVGPNYLVMELLEGKSLTSVLQGRRLTPDEAVRIAEQIVSALEAAHAKGLVHRDIKPGNVFLSPKGHVKVLDFGLAKLTASAASEATTAVNDLSMAGQSVGTVGYMSPEQARGEELDARSDLWSLGVVLYEMLTGARPFQGQTHAVTFTEILTRTPARVSQKAEGVGTELDRVVGKLLEKDRDLRYQSAADVLADLKRIERTGSGTASAPVSEISRAPGRRRRLLVAAGVAALALIGTGAWFYRAQAKPRITSADTLVVADFVNHTGDPVFDDTLREALATKLQQSKLVQPMNSGMVRAKLAEMRLDPGTPITPEVANQICVRSGERATLSGSIAALGSSYVLILKATNCQNGDVLATSQVQTDRKEKVLDALSEAVDAMRTELGERLGQAEKGSGYQSPPLTTASLEAYKAYAAGMKPFAAQKYADAVPHFRRAHEIDPEFAYAILVEGLSAGLAGNDAESDALYRKAYEKRQSASEIERLLIEAEYSLEVGRDREKARKLYEQILALAPNTGLALNRLAIIYRVTGNPTRASQLHEQLLRGAPTMTLSYANLATDYTWLDRFAQARQVLEAAAKQKVELPNLHTALLRIAYMEGDLSAAEKETALIAQRDERPALAIQAQYAYATGRFRDADEMIQRLRGNKNNQVRAFAEDCSALRTAPNALPLMFLLCGESELAAQQAEKSAADSRLDPDLARFLRALAALGRGQPQQTVDALGVAIRVEYPDPQDLILSGRAYLEMKQPDIAAKEFRKAIAYKSYLFEPVLARAHVELARALAAAGDKAGARQAYEAFFKFWKNADPDIPLLLNARKEYAAL